MRIWNLSGPGLGMLAIAVAIAGCGGSSSKSASVSAATTPATAATTPTAPATTSTAAKPPPSKSGKQTTQTTTPAKTTSTQAKPPAAKSSTKTNEAAQQEKAFGKIKLTSAAFKVGGPIATRYTCDGAGLSPPLEWHGTPAGTAEMFVLAVDLSGGIEDIVQWAVGGISPSVTRIAPGGLPAGAVVGANSVGKNGWGGICGAKGQLQHVAFLLYALSHKLDLKSGFNPVVVRKSLKSITLATGLTLATYERH